MNRIQIATIAFMGCLLAGPVASRADPAAAEAPAPQKKPPRPKVGLVLGGGGALGLAHIGVLKVLEEQRIPIDFIGGTSMGSIIAGLYASGMSPDEMQAWLESLDWDEVMSDATPRRELYFRRKQEDQRYLLEMGLNWKGPKMGTGLAAGQKFNNLMQLVTLRAAGITDFDRLPIPYRAVATDLQSGTARVLDHGNLATAMRASMAVPGVFTAVEIDGRVLVDGGIVDNLPVDVVKAMGADVVIAVDVGSDADVVDPESLKSLGGILGRTYTIAQRPEQIEQFKHADIGIQPVLAGLTAGDFARVSEFVPKGAEAARGKRAELARLAVGEPEYAEFLKKQRRPKPVETEVDALAVSGNHRVSDQAIRGRIQSRAGAPFDQGSRAAHHAGGRIGVSEESAIRGNSGEKTVRDGRGDREPQEVEQPGDDFPCGRGLRVQVDKVGKAGIGQMKVDVQNRSPYRRQYGSRTLSVAGVQNHCKVGVDGLGRRPAYFAGAG